MADAVKIVTKKVSSRFVALESGSKSNVLAEGRTVMAVKRNADKTGLSYSMMYLPPKDTTFIY